MYKYVTYVSTDGLYTPEAPQGPFCFTYRANKPYSVDICTFKGNIFVLKESSEEWIKQEKKRNQKEN